MVPFGNKSHMSLLSGCPTRRKMPEESSMWTSWRKLDDKETTFSSEPPKRCKVLTEIQDAEASSPYLMQSTAPKAIQNDE